MGRNELAQQESPLVEKKKHRISIESAAKYRLAVIILSWSTIVLVGILGILTLVAAIYASSSASFAFAIDAFLDCLSSAVVIWRYSGADTSLYSRRKEKLACLLLGTVFLACGCVISVRSVLTIIERIFPEKSWQMMGLTITNGVICTLLSLGKFITAIALESAAILSDAFNSIIGAILAFSIVISEFAFRHDPTVWYLDPLIGLICAVILIIYGIWLIFHSIRSHKKKNPEEESSELISGTPMTSDTENEKKKVETQQ